MAERTEPTAAAFTSSRRSCACGDVDLADDLQLLVELVIRWPGCDELAGSIVHGATACLRQLE